jgi:ATP-dependent protease HslVU (ClpYQ) peptidase subunit
VTCVVGIAQAGKVYIGADSLVSNGYSRDLTEYRKVFRVGELLMGVSGSIRAQNLIQYTFQPRQIEEGEATEHYMIATVAEGIRALLKGGGVTHVENNVETGEYCLIGFRGQLFEMASDFQIGHSLRGLGAIGAGEDFALGALLARPDLEPVARLRMALEVSAELCISVAPPFAIEEI